MIQTKIIKLKTNGNCDVIDVTSRISDQIAASGITNGIVTIFAVGSTAAIGTIEAESGLVADFKMAWDRLVPRSIEYQHDRAWGDGNGHSHIRSSMLGPSLTVPIVSKRLTLGTWQQVIYVDFDNRPRSREVVVQILGE